MKQLAPLCLLLSVVLLLACQDDRLPTTLAPSPDGAVAAATGGGPPVGQTDPADAEGEIQQLLTALFPAGEQGEAKSLFAAIKAATDRDDQAAAEAGVRELVNLALEALAEGSLRDPGGAAPPTTLEALEELVDLLFAFVGQTPPTLDLTLVQQLQGESDFAVQLVGPEGATVVTNTEFAGVDIPDEAIGSDDGTDEQVLITIRRLDPDDQAGGRCLPTGLPQLEGCYEFERSPDGDFADFVTVGVCIDESDPEWPEYQLHKFDPDNPGDGVVRLDEAAAGFLDCQGFAPLAAAGPGPFWNLASTGWDALRSVGAGLLASPLRAADTGAGGLTLSFSDIGWAQAAELTVVSGDGQVGTAGQALSNPLVLSVTGTHNDVGGAVDDALVTYEVVGDASLGGVTDVDPSTSPSLNLQAGAEGTTDAAGQLSVPVTLAPTASGTVTVRAFLAGSPASPVEFDITVGQAIFAASFDAETLGAAPTSPNIGTWTLVDESAGTIRVRSSEGDLTGQPVVFDQVAGLTGGLDLLGEPAGTPPTSGIWDVSWKMLGQTVVGGGFTVRDASSLIVAHVALSNDGDIDAQVNGSTFVDTGVDWTAGQHNDFRLRIDLDQSTVSLFIDGQATTVQDAGFAQAGANGIARLDLTLGTTSDQLFAFDDVLVTPVP